MPLLESSPEGKSWPAPLTTLDPEQVPQRIANAHPQSQQAYYFTPTIQPVMNLGMTTSQPTSATIVPPTRSSSHEHRPITDSLSYKSPVILDPPLPLGAPHADLNFANIQQPSVLKQSAILQVPSARSPAWPMMLQEIPISPNISHMVEDSDPQRQLIDGFGPYSGPMAFSTAQASNRFPTTISDSEIQHLQNPQSMQSAVTPHYSTAASPLVSDCPGPFQPSSVSIRSPTAADYPAVFLLQRPFKNNAPRQESTGFKSRRNTAEGDDKHPQTTQNLASLITSIPTPDYGYVQARAHVWKNIAEDGLSNLNKMTQTWLRSNITCFDDVLQHIPLEELGKQALIIREPGLLPQPKGCSWNLVKIENIPYNLDDDMLFEFLGKSHGLVPEEHGGIHIIMDRTTGKTMDCFLEFPSVGVAERFIQRRCNNNRRCILGGRHISLELVRQGELMRWLFPKVRGATWGEDGDLVVGEWKAFHAPVEIVSREELVMILGHARTPHRSPFSRKCLQRPYESLMSVVTKFPWKETDDYTLKQRDLIFQAAFEAGELLKRQILRGKAGPNIDLRLLRRLCRTISFCPGFTYRQKLTFLDAMGITTTECFTILGDLGISHPLATQFQALTVRPGADYVAVEAIANLVADGVSRGNGIRNETDLGTRLGPGGTRGSNEGGNCELTMRAAASIELETVITAIKTTFATGRDTLDFQGRI
ncbi:hypothetical protein TWF106_006034 [Orbilia oligospora]|uniref:Uncharacterized protein n=1 Tax=Orbilia oligospora TaxID=2813651 RepID=A0A7C8U6L9_ORBOL|nr:hypothetical protein TWF788_003043 [Orbilia oligospora]KAF3194653.1 hypothetical protein TWF106_006034 [Orbilia oligospora]KAF3201958.1 hypothetical protein TWF191_003207 [Orbilia oligospora]